MPAAHSMSLMHQHAGVHPHAGPMSQAKKLRQNAQKLVSQTFFGTLLRQSHNSPFKSKILDGGRGGEAFQSMLDQHLADRMASGASRKLVDAMVKKWQRPGKGAPTGAN